LVAEIDQGVEAFVGDQPHRTAETAVAAVGTTERDELLAAEADAAVAAIAGLDFDIGFVDEFHDRGSALYVRRKQDSRTAAWQTAHRQRPIGDGNAAAETKSPAEAGPSLSRRERLTPARRRRNGGSC